MIKLKKKFIISFMGIDGAGKTTLAKKLQKTIKNSKYLHLKPYIILLDRRTIVRNPHLQKKNSFILSFAKLLGWLLSYKFFFYKNRSKIFFIFDRYAHDILIDPLRYRHNLSKKFTKIILNFFPKPDLWIFLKPSLKTVKSRKIELPDNELNRQSKEYMEFFKNQKNVIILNTNLKKKKLIDLISKKILTLVI
jgi:thymidylate kinase